MRPSTQLNHKMTEIIEVLIPSAVTNYFESVVRAGLCYIISIVTQNNL